MQQAIPVTLPCMCANLRRAARAVTQFYEAALRPLNIRASQFTILQVLSYTGEIPQGKIGAILAMDSTSLTRTLATMRRDGWLDERSGHDRRQKLYRLSPGGKALLKRATPMWEKAQSHLRRQLGKDAWNALAQLTNQVTGMVTDEEESL